MIENICEMRIIAEMDRHIKALSIQNRALYKYLRSQALLYADWEAPGCLFDIVDATECVAQGNDWERCAFYEDCRRATEDVQAFNELRRIMEEYQ